MIREELPIFATASLGGVLATKPAACPRTSRSGCRALPSPDDGHLLARTSASGWRPRNSATSRDFPSPALPTRSRCDTSST